MSATAAGARLSRPDISGIGVKADVPDLILIRDGRTYGRGRRRWMNAVLRPA